MAIFDKFTNNAQEAASRAYDSLQQYHHDQIDTEHLLLALLEQRDSTVIKILERINITAEEIVEWKSNLKTFLAEREPSKQSTSTVIMTSRLQRILDHSEAEADRLGDSQISPEHILLAMLDEKTTYTARLLSGIPKSRIDNAIQELRTEEENSRTQQIQLKEQSRLKEFEQARFYFEPHLQELGLGLTEIGEQPFEELQQSLELLTDISQTPDSFGAYHGIGILPFLLERKKLVLDRLHSLRELASLSQPLRMTNSIFGEPVSNDQFTCDVFVIMPFSPELQPIYDNHIKPLIEEMGLTIRRGDDFFSKKAIMSEIWSAMHASRCILAECTGRNPNVFYELGIAHALDKASVILTQTINDIPFDIRHLRVIEYQPTPKGLTILHVKLADALQKMLKNS